MSVGGAPEERLLDSCLDLSEVSGNPFQTIWDIKDDRDVAGAAGREPFIDGLKQKELDALEPIGCMREQEYRISAVCDQTM